MTALSATDLAAKAREYKLLGSELERIKTHREAISSEIIGELHRRKRSSIEADGVTITLTSRRTGYSVATLRDRLKPAVFKRVTKLVADSDAIRAELKAGTIAGADIVDAEERSRAFPTVTIPEVKAA